MRDIEDDWCEPTRGLADEDGAASPIGGYPANPASGALAVVR
jgi:hypothetical protein